MLVVDDSSSSVCIEQSLSAIDDLLKETDIQLAAIQEFNNSDQIHFDMSASISSSQSGMAANGLNSASSTYHDFSPNGSCNGSIRAVHKSGSWDDMNAPSPEPSFSSLGSEEVRKSLEELDAVIQAFDEEYRDVKTYFHMTGPKMMVDKISPNTLYDRQTPTREIADQEDCSPLEEDFPLPPPPPNPLHPDAMSLNLATSTESYSDYLANQDVNQPSPEMTSTPVMENRIYDLPVSEETPRNSQREQTPEQTAPQRSLSERKTRVPPPHIPKRSPSTCLTLNSSPLPPTPPILEAHEEELWFDGSPSEVVMRDGQNEDQSIDTSSQSVTDIIKRFSNSKSNSGAAADEATKMTNQEPDTSKAQSNCVPLVKQLANQFSAATHLANQNTFNGSTKQMPVGATPILPLNSSGPGPKFETNQSKGNSSSSAVTTNPAANSYMAPVVPPSLRGVNVMLSGPTQSRSKSIQEDFQHSNDSRNSVQPQLESVHYSQSSTNSLFHHNNGSHSIASPSQNSTQTGSPLATGAIPIPVPKIPKKINQPSNNSPSAQKTPSAQLPPPMNPVNTFYSETAGSQTAHHKHSNPPPPAIVPTIPRRGSSNQQTSGSPARQPPPPPAHPPPRNLPPPPPPPSSHPLNLSALPPPPPPPPMQAFSQQPLPPPPPLLNHNLCGQQVPIHPSPPQYSVPHHHQQQYPYYQQPLATSSPLLQRVAVPVPPPLLPGSGMQHLQRHQSGETHSPVMKPKMKRGNDLQHQQRSHSVDTSPDMQAAIVAQLKGGIKLRRASEVKSIEEIPNEQIASPQISRETHNVTVVGQSSPSMSSNRKSHNLNQLNNKGLSTKVTTVYGAFDVKDIPGYQVTPEGFPDWKKQLIDRKNKEVLDAFLKIKEEEEKDRLKWQNVPQWKRALIEKKEMEKTKDNSVKDEEEIEELRDNEDIPEWKKHWIVKKKAATDEVTNES